MLEDLGHTGDRGALGCACARNAAARHQGRCGDDRSRDAGHDRHRTCAADQAALAGLPIILATGYAELPNGEDPGLPRLSKPYLQEELAAQIARVMSAGTDQRDPAGFSPPRLRMRHCHIGMWLAKTWRFGQTGPHNGNVLRSSGQRRGVRLLLGGFYAAVTIGVSISFGMLDIVNIAHPAFIILGSYIAYIGNTTLGIDPILASVIALPAFYLARGGSLSGLLRCLRASRRRSAARPGVLLRPAVHHRGHARAGVRRGLPPGRGTLYRAQPASRRDRSAAAPAGALPGRAGDGRRAATVHVAHFPRPRDPGGGAGPAGAAADGGKPDADQAHRVRPVDRHRLDGRRGADHHPAGRAVDRPRLYRPRVRHLRAGRHGQLCRHAGRGDDLGHRREPDSHVLRPVLVAGGRLRLPAGHAGGAAQPASSGADA